MDGIPASKLTTELTNEETLVPLKYSPVNKATGNENRKQINNANDAVKSVPTTKENAPYSSVADRGSHYEFVIKSQKPYSPKASDALPTKA